MPYTRLDHSPDLIHFTKDSIPWTYKGSYAVFYKIVQDGFLKSSNNQRLGLIHSVCFTEAPLHCLTDRNQLNRKYFKRYSPFGFLFSKNYIYEKDGLPVIYSPKHDFESSNNKTNWRTVSFDPIEKYGTFRDYTWEREWRIKPQAQNFNIEKENVKLILPSEKWITKFRDDHDEYHKDPSCNCHCSRNARVISYNEYFSVENHSTLEGSCPDKSEFPWLIINLECKGVPSPD